jgi:hypothetical protein
VKGMGFSSALIRRKSVSEMSGKIITESRPAATIAGIPGKAFYISGHNTLLYFRNALLDL